MGVIKSANNNLSNEIQFHRSKMRKYRMIDKRVDWDGKTSLGMMSIWKLFRLFTINFNVRGLIIYILINRIFSIKKQCTFSSPESRNVGNTFRIVHFPAKTFSQAPSFLNILSSMICYQYSFFIKLSWNSNC